MTEDVLGVLFEGEVLPENAQTAEQQHANPAPAEQQDAEKYRERARAKQCSGSQSRASGGANSY